jgi:rSAM/selenodomain-associated transferase 1
MNPFHVKRYHGKKNIKKISGRVCILVFVRAPEMGKVKTRLANVIGQDAALRLYKSFVADELDMLRDLFFDVIICYHPPTARETIGNWLNKEFNFMAQSGKDLGQRMENAFEEVFSWGYQQALLIGSDLPDLPSSIILDAFDHLTRQDAVIGPCEDGGYYLIGFHRDTYSGEVFMKIPWGTAQVFDRTLLRFHKKNLTSYILPRWRDIDDFEDLLWLKKSLDKIPTKAKHTHSYLMNLLTSPVSEVFNDTKA